MLTGGEYAPSIDGSRVGQKPPSYKITSPDTWIITHSLIYKEGFTAVEIIALQYHAFSNHNVIYRGDLTGLLGRTEEHASTQKKYAKVYKTEYAYNYYVLTHRPMFASILSFFDCWSRAVLFSVCLKLYAIPRNWPSWVVCSRPPVATIEHRSPWNVFPLELQPVSLIIVTQEAVH